LPFSNKERPRRFKAFVLQNFSPAKVAEKERKICFFFLTTQKGKFVESFEINVETDPQNPQLKTE